ncbi:MAG TPA: UvrB/UvrC motif-containing protein [Bacillota bacterium]|nr:UvrB/UvrC motif-containing protein [Bacillota bacterium]
MLCQECQKKTANVHLTQMVNGQKTELYLCETCAAKHSPFGINLVFPIQFSMHHLLSGLMQETEVPTPEQGEKADLLTCPFCGMTFDQFKRQGRFGCAQCYDTFSDRLPPLFRRIHGSHQHTGKIPLRAGKELQFQNRLAKLKQQLQQAIAEEAFERAATLRDEIKQLSQPEQKEE